MPAGFLLDPPGQLCRPGQATHQLAANQKAGHGADAEPGRFAQRLLVPGLVGALVG
ncbi:hypothetical protein [Hymenobacter algoricola]|uniref:hypothetical protein n=1 Tax=Hymenobacter algoricola TaxID=486267 RepID=UPI0031F16B8B